MESNDVVALIPDRVAATVAVLGSGTDTRRSASTPTSLMVASTGCLVRSPVDCVWSVSPSQPRVSPTHSPVCHPPTTPCSPTHSHNT